MIKQDFMLPPGWSKYTSIITDRQYNTLCPEKSKPLDIVQ